VFASAKSSTVLIVADQDETGTKTYTKNQTNDSLERFIAEFVRAGESGSSDGQTEFYASPCDYFENGQCTRESIYSELRDYDSKWPSREYRLLGTPVANVANEGDTYDVGFKVQFALHNRSKALSGICYFRAQVVRSESSFLITSIRESFSTGGSQMGEGGSRLKLDPDAR